MEIVFVNFRHSFTFSKPNLSIPLCGIPTCSSHAVNILPSCLEVQKQINVINIRGSRNPQSSYIFIITILRNPISTTDDEIIGKWKSINNCTLIIHRITFYNNSKYAFKLFVNAFIKS